MGKTAREDTQKPILLIVDDTPENIDILKGALMDDFTIRPATSGPLALKVANLAPRPDLILLDVMMPGMDGYEVCRRLKAAEETREIPVIFVTAKSQEADELEGLALGAVDYITKPISVPIVQARVRTHLALRQAKKRIDMQNHLLLHEREMIETIVLRMRGADALDQRFLRYLIAPVEKTAGDMLLATFTPDGRQLVLLGDFTGHGLSAAIGGPLVTYMLHDMAQEGVLGLEIMRRINVQLSARLPVSVFFAAALLEIDPKRRTVRIVNAGLPELLLVRQGRVRERFPSLLPPLGILKTLEVVETMVAVEGGDRLFAFSDGIIEATDPQGEMFGMDRLQGAILSMLQQDGSPQQLIDALNRHTGIDTFEDDLTLVEIAM